MALHTLSNSNIYNNEQTFSDASVFGKLKKLFSNDVIIRNVGGKKLKLIDSDEVQRALDRNSLRDRFNRIRSTAAIAQRDMIMSYQSSRIELFRDFDTMAMDPIIASALDIVSDECCTKNEMGYILNINSSDENIKQILHNLFNDILNIEFNLWSWAYNMLKYGDFFLKLELSPEYGIFKAIPLSSYEVTRLEGTDPENPNYVKFKHDGAQGGAEYENFEVAHFRLISDTNFLPYGKSYLENARRVWKQISLMEDALLIHRIMRAPEKRIFKIDIGNIPPSEVDGFMEKIVSKMKKIPYIDEKTGDYNLRFNLQPVRGDTKIPLLDGRAVSIKELSKEWESGKKNYVYSVDRNDNGKIVSGEVLWCGLTKENADLVRVTLDDDSYVDFEPNHPVMLRDCSYKSAKDLCENDSLMPFDEKSNYIFDPNSQTYIPTNNILKEKINILSENEIQSINHTVKKIEFLSEKDDVYCMNVKTYHNFAIDSHGGTERNGFFVKNSMMEDFFIPVRGGDSGTSIEPLGGMEWTGIEDIDYLKNKLLAALKVPKAFLGFDEGIAKSNLAMEDIRFSRTITRIQNILVSELTKIAVIHLYCQGFRDATLVDFELELTNPSTILEQEKLELWKSKMDLSKDMIDSKLFSRKWIYSNIFHLSDLDQNSLKEDLLKDIRETFRYSKIEDEGTDPYLTFKKIKTSDELDSFKPGKEGGGDGDDSGGDGGGDSGGGLPDLGGGFDDDGGDDGGDSGGLPDLPPLTEEHHGLKDFNKEKEQRKKDALKKKKKHKYKTWGEDRLGDLELHRIGLPKKIKQNKSVLKENDGNLSFLDESNIIDE
jgi:hypothetical protein